MEKLITIILICISLSASAQVKDSVIRITLTQAQWQTLVSKNRWPAPVLVQNRASKETFEILFKNAALVPKEEEKK